MFLVMLKLTVPCAALLTKSKQSSPDVASPNPNLVQEFAQIPSLPSAPELELVKFELASKLVEQLNPSFIIAPPSTFLLEIGFRVNSFKLGKLKRNHGKH